MSKKRLVWLLAGIGGLCLLAAATVLVALVASRLLMQRRAGPRVELFVDWSAESAMQTEQQITCQLEVAIAGLPRLTNMRTLSTAGGSHIALTFERGTSSAEAKQLVAERLHLADLPATAVPEFSPLADAHELLRYTIVERGDRHKAPESRWPHDREVARRLYRVPGVAKVSLSGAPQVRLEVLVDPDRLSEYGLSLSAMRAEISDRLGQLNKTSAHDDTPSGGAQALADIVLDRGKESQTRVRDIASIQLASVPRSSRVGETWREKDGWQDSDNVVQGVVWARNGADELSISQAVHRELAEVATAGLPATGTLHVENAESSDVQTSERTFWLQGELPADLSGEQVAEQLRNVRRSLQSFEEVQRIVTQAGPVTDERPARAGGIDVQIICRPIVEWPPAPNRDKPQTLASLQSAVMRRLNREVPGASWRTTQSPPGEWWRWWCNHSGQAIVKILGEDLNELESLAEDVRTRFVAIPGVDASWRVPSGSATMLRWDIDRSRCADAGVAVADVEMAFGMANGGVACGRLVDVSGNTDVVLRWPDKFHSNPESLADIKVSSAKEVPIQLRMLASSRREDAPLQICREWSFRLVAVGLSAEEPMSAAVKNAKVAAQELVSKSSHRSEWDEP